MSDEMPSPMPNGWTKLYGPGGSLVTLPVPVGNGEKDYYAVAFAAVAAALEAGFTVEAPGLEVGEMKEEVGWVSRSTHEGRTGMADVIAFYSTNEGWTKPFLTDYLNTDADRQEFASATGIKPASIPEYVGEGRLDRANNKTAHLIVKLPRPVSLVMKPNPKYNEAESAAAKAANKVYKIPKKLFVRWAEQKPVAQSERQPEPAQQQSGPSESNDIAGVRAYLADRPDALGLNNLLPSLSKMSLADKPLAWRIIKEYALGRMLNWNEADRRFEEAF